MVGNSCKPFLQQHRRRHSCHQCSHQFTNTCASCDLRLYPTLKCSESFGRSKQQQRRIYLLNLTQHLNADAAKQQRQTCKLKHINIHTSTKKCTNAWILCSGAHFSISSFIFIFKIFLPSLIFTQKYFHSYFSSNFSFMLRRRFGKPCTRLWCCNLMLFRGERGHGTFAGVQSQAAGEYIACACGGTFFESGQKYRRKYLQHINIYICYLFHHHNAIFT